MTRLCSSTILAGFDNSIYTLDTAENPGTCMSDEITNNTPTTPPTSPQPIPPQAPSQPAYKPSLKIKLLICLLGVVLSFVSVYTVAWFGYRDNPEVQGTYNQQLVQKLSLLDRYATDYKKLYGQYPETMQHLLGMLEPDIALNETNTQISEMHDFMRFDPWGQPIQYVRVDHDSYTFKSNGRDGKPGGVGSNADITMGDKRGINTQPTFTQLIFDIEYSPTFFKISFFLSMIALLAIQLQLSRKSAAMTRQRLVFDLLILLPCCIIVAAWLVVGHLMPDTYAH